MSPSVFVNVDAQRSTNAGGGSSLTKCRASFVVMNFAVAGCTRDDVEHSSPSSSPRPDGNLWPRISLLAGVVRVRD